MKQRKKDEIELFKEFIVARGGELLIPTNQWEIVRYRGGGTTSVIYVNKKGKRSFTGVARSAWDAFKDQSPTYRVDLRTVGQTKGAYQASVIVRTIVDRDGDACFYCGSPFGEGLSRTREHLVSQTHKGPNHISNLFLSCSICNGDAGHLSAPEKIRMRDRKRRGRGSMLLARVVNRLVSGEGDPTLLDDINRFLYPAGTEESSQ